MDGQRVGPYLLRHRIGAGGMGEVWEGWDERLRRPVAIKRLDRDGDPVSRERLLREARTVAALSHPGIVAIHDIVEEPDRVSLILELVEGETIRRIVERAGPLAADQVIDLGLQVASALAAAHERGIIHRDLKSENVMRTPDGRIRVLDFGIARRDADPDGTIAPDGRIAGTLRAMSPEQALGRPLDPRSDLFSLGVLLYEAATGVSPFRGDGPADTLQRLCTRRPPPARQLAPSLPPELSNLIDRLLEKERAHRPRDAQAVADALRPPSGTWPEPLPQAVTGEPTILPGALAPALPVSGTGSFAPVRRRRALLAVGALGGAALAAVLLFRAGFLPDKSGPLRIAVPRPVVIGATADPLTDTAVRLAVLRALADAPDVDVVPFDETDAADLPPARLAAAVAADEVVTTRVECRGLLCQAQIERRRPREVVAALGFQIPADQLLLLTDGIEERARQIYGLTASSPPEISAEDQRLYFGLRRAFDGSRGGPAAREIRERLGEIRGRAPGFVEIYLFEARVGRYVWSESRDAADLERVITLLAAARRLAPASPLPGLAEADLWIDAGRLDDAERALAALARDRPEDPAVLLLQARAAERQGNAEEALLRMRRAVALRPSWQYRLNLARLAFHQGLSTETRAQIDNVLALVPDQPRARALLGQVEMVSGDPARAVTLFTRLTAEAPRVAHWSNLGLAELLLGRYGEAATSYRRAAEMAPDNAGVLLNQADAEALLGHGAAAETLYLRVLDLTAGAEPEDWQTLATRGQALAHLGRPREAVIAIQEALRRAPDEPQAAYTAALVYAVVGDRTSALANAERALRRGLQPRWFRLPWFAPFADDLPLQDPGGGGSPGPS
jgi:serine/threonine-protein kinase